MICWIKLILNRINSKPRAQKSQKHILDYFNKLLEITIFWISEVPS